jgi:Glyoxalase/Bleomycin resistance protein/Dioxygenase superfamily
VLSNDDANHRIALLAFPNFADDPDKDNRTGMHHSAFEYASFDDLNASYLRLREAGITPALCLDHGMTFSYYYADPDGNNVELQVDCFGDWKQSKEWMRTSEAFKANPIGHFVDAERVAADHAAGLAGAPGFRRSLSPVGVHDHCRRWRDFAPQPRKVGEWLGDDGACLVGEGAADADPLDRFTRATKPVAPQRADRDGNHARRVMIVHRPTLLRDLRVGRRRLVRQDLFISETTPSPTNAIEHHSAPLAQGIARPRLPPRRVRVVSRFA